MQKSRIFPQKSSIYRQLQPITEARNKRRIFKIYMPRAIKKYSSVDDVKPKAKALRDYLKIY